MSMHITIVGASDTYALGFTSWAVAAGHQVTIVGPSRGQAEAFAKKINAARATGPHDPIVDNVIFLAMPYNCVLDARDFYGSQLDRKIVVDLTTPINPGTFERIHTEAGSVAQEITRARPGARVVKAFNPRFIGTLGAEQGSTQHTRDLAGDDVEAKHLIAQLFDEGDLRPIDAGPLRRARELEAVGYLSVVTRLSLAADFVAG
jgi:8-hydroxy-5-deazaflavin:NADPH oxidoreductase